jgi:hypothetical protein
VSVLAYCYFAVAFMAFYPLKVVRQLTAKVDLLTIPAKHVTAIARITLSAQGNLTVLHSRSDCFEGAIRMTKSIETLLFGLDFGRIAGMTVTKRVSIACVLFDAQFRAKISDTVSDWSLTKRLLLRNFHLCSVARRVVR